MDVREAVRKVKDYFQEVKGIEPLAFDVESVRFNPEKKEWNVVCSFYRNPVDAKRVSFTLIVDDATGEIKEHIKNGHL